MDKNDVLRVVDAVVAKHLGPQASWPESAIRAFQGGFLTDLRTQLSAALDKFASPITPIKEPVAAATAAPTTVTKQEVK